jgi:hypothetical protein
MFDPRIDPRNPDGALVALFRNHAMPNEAKSIAENRLICDDVEIVEIRAPGSRNVHVFPATAVSHWDTDPHTGGQRKVTYAERFSRQYQQFKSQVAQTKSGTPLTHAPFLTEGRRAELRAQNVYTVEQLALIDGNELKNLGPGGRDMKNRAQEYMADAKRGAPSAHLAAELEALRAKNATLEEDLEAAKKAAAAQGDAEFDDMTDDQLKAFIRTQTGHVPAGSPGRKTLVRMAIDARGTKAA